GRRQSGAGGEPRGLVGVLVGSASAVEAEDGSHLVGAADADVVGHQRLEESSGSSGIVEDQRAGDFDLAHRQLPAVAGGPVVAGERGRDGADPTVEQGLHVGGPEAVTDGLESLGAGAGSQTRGALSQRGPRLLWLAVWPHARRIPTACRRAG